MLTQERIFHCNLKLGKKSLGPEVSSFLGKCILFCSSDPNSGCTVESLVAPLHVPTPLARGPLPPLPTPPVHLQGSPACSLPLQWLRVLGSLLRVGHPLAFTPSPGRPSGVSGHSGYHLRRGTVSANTHIWEGKLRKQGRFRVRAGLPSGIRDLHTSKIQKALC